MKKYVRWIMTVAICCIIVVLVFISLRDEIDLTGKCSCIVFSDCEGRKQRTVVSSEDTQTVAKLIDGHYLYQDSPSCGVSERASIEISNERTTHVFYIASDGCPILYEPVFDRYVKLKESEMKSFIEILSGYGLKIPCV